MAQVGVAIWAVIWLKRTFKQSEKLIDETTRIGNAQVRAYLYCKLATYELGKDYIAAKLEIENTGQSPASNVYINGELTILLVGGKPKMPRTLGYCVSHVNQAQCEPVRVGGKIEETIYFHWDIDFVDYDGNFEVEETSWRANEKLFKTGNEILFLLHIEWTDVFDKPNKIPIALEGCISAGPNAPGMRRVKTGKLSVRGEDERFTYDDDNQEGI